MTSLAETAKNLSVPQFIQPKYRADIDGLRALAVLAVLLFHFDLGVPGGYVGVDVFFVISGFLITDTIRNSITQNRFSFLSFYTRRLLRLHPALLATIAASLLTGFLIMDPASLSKLASSAKYSLLSASNFYFFNSQGYFEETAKMQPLLHTWSLSVEWQFYLVWPLIVWGSLKVSNKFLAIVLAILTIVSVASSQAMLSINPSASYYMMPFRVFELCIGAFLVLLNDKRSGVPLERLVFAAGIITIIAASFLLKHDSLFPGLLALAPCLGAAACIYAGRSDLGALTRNKVAVYIGKISYSVYLVHWPILVFYKYYIFREITVSESACLLLASLVAGSAMHHLIENIFVSKKSRTMIIGTVVVVIATSAGVYGSREIIKHQGLSYRLPKAYMEMASRPAEFHRTNYGGDGYELDASIGEQKSTPDYLIVGDSFALQYMSGLDKILHNTKKQARGFFAHGCYISRDYIRINQGIISPDCKAMYKTLMDSTQGNNTPVMFALHWVGYSDYISDNASNPVKFNSNEEYENFIIKNLSELRKDLGDRKLVLVGSPPYRYGASSLMSCLLRPHMISQPCDSFIYYPTEVSAAYSINNKIREFANNTQNTYFVAPSDAICTKGTCSPFVGRDLAYSDMVHLSKSGSSAVSELIIKALEDSPSATQP
ncbi:acyltransferase family protein [Pseudomonas purpurea]|uniref:acyltransferase family protein n=1 Tax=Pseudomonas purpurea TaxID=3136737 RepID=UPI00326441BC